MENITVNLITGKTDAVATFDANGNPVGIVVLQQLSNNIARLTAELASKQSIADAAIKLGLVVPEAIINR